MIYVAEMGSCLGIGSGGLAVAGLISFISKLVVQYRYYHEKAI
jgi:hypothetical protein